jgi:hypothetical protein
MDRECAETGLHVCYALSLDEEELYADLVAISALSLRRVHPFCLITVLTDDTTHRMFRHRFERFSLDGMDVKSLGAYEGGASFRSRFVKTQARSALDGDFLYLDADTLALADLSKLLECHAPIAGAVNRSDDAPAGTFPVWALSEYDQLGWGLPSGPYLNAGVIFWKDCAKARALGELWHKSWLRYASTFANPRDQPTFNYSLFALGIKPEIMDECFNARPRATPKITNSPRLYHFYFLDEEKPEGDALGELLTRYRQSRQVDFGLVDDVIRRGHPWTEVDRPQRDLRSVDELPFIGRNRRWDLMEGLSVTRLADSTFVRGQSVLRLAALESESRHAIAIRFDGLAAGQAYRISVFAKAALPTSVMLSARDGISPMTGYPRTEGALRVDLVTPKVLEQAGLRAHGIECLSEGWHRLWGDLETRNGELFVLVGLLERGTNLHLFWGNGQKMLLGGLEVGPVP